jgi:hypothetical protein
MHRATERVKGFYAKMKRHARLETKSDQTEQGSSMLANAVAEISETQSLQIAALIWRQAAGNRCNSVAVGVSLR